MLYVACQLPPTYTHIHTIMAAGSIQSVKLLISKLTHTDGRSIRSILGFLGILSKDTLTCRLDKPRTEPLTFYKWTTCSTSCAKVTACVTVTENHKIHSISFIEAVMIEIAVWMFLSQSLLDLHGRSFKVNLFVRGVCNKLINLSNEIKCGTASIYPDYHCIYTTRKPSMYWTGN